MGFTVGRYAKIWSFKDEGKWGTVNLSVSRKDKETGVYKTDFKDGFVSVVGRRAVIAVPAGVADPSSVIIVEVEVKAIARLWRPVDHNGRRSLRHGEVLRRGFVFGKNGKGSRGGVSVCVGNGITEGIFVSGRKRNIAQGLFIGIVLGANVVAAIDLLILLVAFGGKLVFELEIFDSLVVGRVCKDGAGV